MKHITIFEEFRMDNNKEIRAESQEGWVDIRDTIQELKPFVILNFKDSSGYSRYIDDTDNNYIKQEYTSFSDGKEQHHSSIFIAIEVDVSDEDFKKYNIRSIVVGKKEKPDVKFKTIDSSAILGNEIESSLSMDDMYGMDYYKVSGNHYRFLNYLG